MFDKKPFVDGKKILCAGVINNFQGRCLEVFSPIIDPNSKKRSEIGRVAQMDGSDVGKIINSSQLAWNHGMGEWPQMSVNDRIKALKCFICALKERRDDIVHVLMWEICKSTEDAQSEFDRTINFMESSICAFKSLDEQEGQLRSEDGYIAKIRRGPVGVVANLGPFNYPLNESYATLFPSLLCGNVVIFKIPSVGGLVHFLTMEAFAKFLPAGVMNFISGSGKELMAPLMNSGVIDALAFIGSSKAADLIIKEHPAPHRLRVFLQLESKNLGIVLPSADLDIAAKCLALGATSFNGQRCTAIKLIMVQKNVVNDFLPKLCQYVSNLKCGLPWEEDVKITPLPEIEKPKYLNHLIEDAELKGAKVVNKKEGGGQYQDSLFYPAIVYPITEDMRLWHEEQFGPIIPVLEYDTLDEVYDYLSRTPYGLQASVFTGDAKSAGELVDVLSNTVGRININTQCSRFPDTFPFTGRRSSGLGTMSIQRAIDEFSVEVVVAAKQEGINEKILRGLETDCHFFEPVMELDMKGCK